MYSQKNAKSYSFYYQKNFAYKYIKNVAISKKINPKRKKKHTEIIWVNSNISAKTPQKGLDYCNYIFV